MIVPVPETQEKRSLMKTTLAPRILLVSAALDAVGFLAVSPAVSKDEIYIADRWSAPNPDYDSYSNLLIIGISEDVQARKQFEYKFVSHLKGRGIEAVTSSSIVPDLAAVTVDRPHPVRDVGGPTTEREEQRAAWRD